MCISMCQSLDYNMMEMTINVSVGSENIVKISAVREGFDAVWPDTQFEFFPRSVESIVSAQPMTDEETIKGALYRARAVLGDADYGVGLEGGIHQIDQNWFSCGWAVVVNRAGDTGIGSSPRIMLPPAVMDLIHQGMELADIDDRLFGITKSGQGEGNFGLMTGGLITRQSAYTQAVIVALTRFTQSQIF
jgi:inosine/xanthosine triphosphatase